jgi:hypothetical protein
MANRKALMFDADAYTPANDDFFKWDSTTEALIPTAGPTVLSNLVTHTGTSAVTAASYNAGVNHSLIITGHIAVSVITPGGVGTNYAIGSSCSWHIPAVIFVHSTGATYSVTPNTWNITSSNGLVPTNDQSAGGLFADARLGLSASSGIFYFTYTPDTGANSTIAGTVVKIATQLLVSPIQLI